MQNILKINHLANKYHLGHLDTIGKPRETCSK